MQSTEHDARIQIDDSGWLPGSLMWDTVGPTDDGRPEVLYELWIHVNDPPPGIGDQVHQIRVKVDRRDYGKLSGIDVPSSIENLTASGLRADGPKS